MKFSVIRTSSRRDKCPCEGCKSEKISRREIRHTKTLRGAQKEHWYQEWFDSGTNHREENGYIVCDSKEKYTIWTIEFVSFRQFMEFVKGHGEVIVYFDNIYNYNTLEIYDFYRE